MMNNQTSLVGYELYKPEFDADLTDLLMERLLKRFPNHNIVIQEVLFINSFNYYANFNVVVTINNTVTYSGEICYDCNTGFLTGILLIDENESRIIFYGE